MTISSFNPGSSTSYTTTITPGTGNYAVEFTVGQYATVVAASGAAAVQATGYAALLNSGTLIGGAGGGAGVFFAPGAGGYLRTASGSSITGGAGGAAGVAGGVGAYLTYGQGAYGNGNIDHSAGYITGGAGGAGAAGGAGVYLLDNAAFNNYGTITGGQGGAPGTAGLGGVGGDGVDLASATLYLNGTVRGGAGGEGASGGIGIRLASSNALAEGSSTGTYGGAGGAGAGGIAGGTGGAGAQLSAGALYNEAKIIGGRGGAYSGAASVAIPLTDAGGAGGVGVAVAAGANFINAAGQALNPYSGYVAGGAGGSAQGFGGAGGTGLELAAGASVTNDGAVAGGTGGAGIESGAGGVGAVVESGATLHNVSAHTVFALGAGNFVTTTVAASIVGGSGGSGSSGTNGGVGGAGVQLSSATLINDGVIQGGSGGASNQHLQSSGFSLPPQGGTGGTGVVATGSAALTNTGSIDGGTGGAGTPPPSGYSSPSGSFFVTTSIGGNGGVGMDLGASTSTLDNAGSIQGGASGVIAAGGSNTESYRATGGVGLAFSNTTVINSGSITGGSGGTGGSGVSIGGGTLITSGTISGGTGTGSAGIADAVLFGGSAATLVVDPGAVFHGVVAANGVSDTLELSGTEAAGTPITLGTQFEHFATLEFASGAAWTVDATTAALVAPPSIVGFAQGDVLDVTNLTPLPALDHFNAATDVLSLSNGATLAFSGSFAGEHFSFGADTAGTGTAITLQPGVACYLRGTRISTVDGEWPIERLMVGDRVRTRSGEPQAIRWIGRRAIDCSRHEHPERVWPIRIGAGALAEKVPSRDLWVSPGHSMFLGGVLIQAERLLNGATIVQVPVQRVEYWHVELDRHDLLLADGAPSESYLDTGNRAAFANAGTVVETHPDFQAKHWRETCVPLVLEGESLVRERTRLLERARALGHGITHDGGVHVLADGVRIDPLVLGDTRLAFVLPAGSRRIELCSRTFVPAQIDASSHDARDLGLCVGRLEIDGDPVGLTNDSLFATGWHLLETPPEGPARRWSQGVAVLPPMARLVVIELAARGYYWMPFLGDARGKSVGSA